MPRQFEIHSTRFKPRTRSARASPIISGATTSKPFSLLSRSWMRFLSSRFRTVTPDWIMVRYFSRRASGPVPCLPCHRYFITTTSRRACHRKPADSALIRNGATSAGRLTRIFATYSFSQMVNGRLGARESPHSSPRKRRTSRTPGTIGILKSSSITRFIARCRLAAWSH